MDLGLVLLFNLRGLATGAILLSYLDYSKGEVPFLCMVELSIWNSLRGVVCPLSINEHILGVLVKLGKDSLGAQGNGPALMEIVPKGLEVSQLY